MAIFTCDECKARVQLVIAHRYNRSLNGEGPDEHYIFGHCAECHRPAILEFTERAQDEFDFVSQAYPPLDTGIPYKLPPKVEESYREARLCQRAGSHIATAVMVRRTLEAVAREFSQNSRNLVAALGAMHNQGVISNELALWGDQLRFLGNVGAHPTNDRVTALDAKEAVEFLEAIVETIYYLRPKFQAMKARRETAKTAPDASTSTTAADSQRNAEETNMSAEGLILYSSKG
jgi:hypothetical protein